MKPIRRSGYGLAWLLGALTGLYALPALAQSTQELRQMSIDDLANLEITSVSKEAESISQAPAAIYVVTQKDIEGAAINTLPEALRLAPNLDVAQTSPSAYNIASRGLSGNTAAQNFPNKLLVLIDGRSVYSPLYSGVYWDLQNLMMNDVDRVEVISGPGATLWGANAMNGVINVTSRSSAQTQGGLLDVRGGNLGGGGNLRYGGRLNEDLTYRAYASGFAQSAFDNPDGTSAKDGSSSVQGGFRFDWSKDRNLVTVQGDIYRVDEDRAGNPVERGRGGNVLTRWQHDLGDGSSLQVQAYYDYVYRGAQGDAGAFHVSTYDLELQHTFHLFDWNKVVWGVGERITPYTIHEEIGAGTSLLFSPASRTLQLTDFFVEDHIAVAKAIDLTIGVKIEDDPYSGVTPMPSVRLAWRPTDGALLWAAASRAIRSPTPFDADVVEKLGTAVFLQGNPNFRPEGLSAYEAGYRGVIGKNLSISVSGYLNLYDHLKSIEITPVTFLPLFWGNTMEGKVYGVQAWADFQVLSWWRLSGGLVVLREDLRFKPGASGLLGVSQAGDDPHFRATLHSLMDFGKLAVDADLHYTARRPNPIVPAYTEINLALTWTVRDDLELYLSGMNLLHDKHLEFSPGDEIDRSVTGGARWRF